MSALPFNISQTAGLLWNQAAAALNFSTDRQRARDFLPTLPSATRLLNQAVRVYNDAEARGLEGRSQTIRLRDAIERGFIALADVNEGLDAMAPTLSERGAPIQWRRINDGLGRIYEAPGFWAVSAFAAAVIAGLAAAPFIAKILLLAAIVASLLSLAAEVSSLIAEVGKVLNPTDQEGKPRTSGLIGFGTLAVIGLGLWLFAGRKRGAA